MRTHIPVLAVATPNSLSQGRSSLCRWKDLSNLQGKVCSKKIEVIRSSEPSRHWSIVKRVRRMNVARKDL